MINTIRVSHSVDDFGRLIFVTLMVAILIAYVVTEGRCSIDDKVKIVFVYCPGNGRHMARRQLHLIQRGGNVLIRCELCGIYWLQRSSRWEQIEQAMRKIDQRELSIKELPALKGT